jgi:ABC-type multidrug transport system ATPase subunit
MRSVSLKVQRGERLVVLGPNGAGTTHPSLTSWGCVG